MKVPLFTKSALSLVGRDPLSMRRLLTTLLIMILSSLSAALLTRPTVARGSLPDNTPTPAMIGQHHVQPGDTIYCVGRAYGVYPKAIAQMNNLDTFALLLPGQILNIPAVQWITMTAGPVCTAQFNSPFPAWATTTRSTVSSATPVAFGTPLGSHVVQRGETVYCIGRAYAVWPRAITKANALRAPFRLYPGQTLTIPAVRWVAIPVGPVCRAQFASPFVNATVTPTDIGSGAAPSATFTPTPTRGGPTKTPLPTRTAPPKP